MQVFLDKRHDFDPLWHVQVVLLAVVGLQLALPSEFTFSPKFIVIALELLCLMALQLVTPKKAVFDSSRRRMAVFALITVILLANVSSLELLLLDLITAGHDDAPRLLFSATSIYLTNVVMFALFYWEMDNGGPGARRMDQVQGRDFLFPQQNLGYTLKKSWYPTFLDYVYLSVTNATAFSPTDTLPLSRRAKFLMGVQALVSLLLVILVAARAINIL
jgi:uncharacterized membrane protein